MSAPHQWIIQRCAQRMVGTQLAYEDCSSEAMTEAVMLHALEETQQRNRHDEFRGHNIANCRCESHAGLKGSAR